MSRVDNQESQQLHDNQDNQKLTIKQVATRLNETPNIIRNWLRELKPYIPVEKGNNNYTYFNQEGIDKLLLIQKMSREQGYSIKQIEFYFATGEDPIKMESINPEFKNEILRKFDNMEELLKQQQEFSKALLTKLDKQQHYIDDSIKKRDEHLLEHIKSLQQAKIETAATEKKGFFSKLFKKNN